MQALVTSDFVIAFTFVRFGFRFVGKPLVTSYFVAFKFMTSNFVPQLLLFIVLLPKNLYLILLVLFLLFKLH